MEALIRQMNDESEKAQVNQRKLQKGYQSHQQLTAQLSENESVKEELEFLTDANIIYKLVGPLLVKQYLSEAKNTVEKRINYIQSELKRHNETISCLEKEQEESRKQMMKIQQRFQQEKAKAISST